MSSARPSFRSSKVAVTSLLFMSHVTELEALHDYLNRVELEALLPEAWAKSVAANI